MKLQKIAIQAQGSRGDVQPYIAIALALQQAGYDVRILTNSNHVPFVENFGIPVRSFRMDIDKVLTTDPVMLKAMADGNTQDFFGSVEALTRNHAVEICEDFLRVMPQDDLPDLFLVGAGGGPYFGLYSKHMFKVPTLDVVLQAVSLEPDRAPWGLPLLPNNGHFDLLRGMMIQGAKAWDHFDQAMVSLGGSAIMPSISLEQMASDFLEVPTHRRIVCQSPLFKDILYRSAHENLVLVGASVLTANQQTSVQADFGDKEALDAFLAADPDRVPVYCGWGSMLCKTPEHMVQLAVKALQLSQQRGIILGGWAKLSFETLEAATDDQDLLDYAKDHILFVQKAPHEYLFPKVACTVHHGGAGTTNAALRAGVPTVITPVFVDQYDHAHLVSELGVGVGFSSSQLQKITPQELSDAIVKVLKEESIAKRAKEVGEILQKEDGTYRVVDEIQKFWDDQIVTGKYWEIEKQLVANAAKP